jgi:dTDP-4-amino-4,6-dideoxygalactose transaminase
MSIVLKVPFVQSHTNVKQGKYIANVLNDPNAFWEQPYTAQCTSILESFLSPSKIYLTGSCTAALEACALILEIVNGDEVIVPSFTHVSTVLPFVRAGATPIFVDINPYTFCIDEDEAIAAITPKTKAILCVNYGGRVPEYTKIKEALKGKNIWIVEDNAHGLGTEIDSGRAGTFGDLSVLSFEKQKNISCHQGGAVVVNNPDFLEKAAVVLELGTNRVMFERGLAKSYEWIDLGIKNSFSELNAAYLLPQLEVMSNITDARRRAWNYYYQALNGLKNKFNIQIPLQLPMGVNAHIFYIILESQEVRNNLISYLNSQAIEAPFHYYPLHLSLHGKEVGKCHGALKETLRAGFQLIRLPLFQGISFQQQDVVLGGIRSFFKDK